MSFLNPLLLGGLVAIGIPILIHLLNRRRFRRVVWAAMRFLQTSIEKNQKRMQIEDLILLVLRCMIVALIALALARPAWREAVSGYFSSEKSVGVLLLDNSLSMGTSDGTSTRFEKAKKAAEQALDSLPSGSAIAVWFVSDVIRDVIPDPSYDLNLARKLIRDAPLTDRGTDVGAAMDRAIEVLKTRMGVRREIYLFTDGQLAGWRGLLDVRSRLERAKNEVQAHIVFVSEHDTQNLSVRDLRLASGLAPVGQPLRFEIKVQNHGLQPAKDVRVVLSVDEEPSSDEFTLPILNPGESKGVALFAKLRNEGIHAIRASVTNDRLPADNTRTLAVRALKQLRVLMVDGDPGDSSRAGETFFLRHALTPVPSDQVPNYFIKTQTLPPTELSGVSLDDFDVLILANVKRFAESWVPALVSYVRRGGGLLVFPGDQIDAAFYNEQLGVKTHLLPATFGPARGEGQQSDSSFALQTKDYAHPITSLWNDPAAGTLASVKVYRHLILLPASHATNEVSSAKSNQDEGLPQTVLSLEDSSPWIVEASFGLGRVVMFGSTADSAWTDLPVRPAFVPLLHRTLGSVIQRQDEGLNLRVGHRFGRRVSNELLGKDAAFTSPRKGDTVRELKRVEMVNGSPMMTFDHTDYAGLYRVAVSDPAYETAFATQASPDESSLEEISSEQVQALKSVAEVYSWSSNFSLRQIVERQRSGVEFWPAVLLAALLLSLSEGFLGQWFSRSR